MTKPWYDKTTTKEHADHLHELVQQGGKTGRALADFISYVRRNTEKHEKHIHRLWVAIGFLSPLAVFGAVLFILAILK